MQSKRKMKLEAHWKRRNYQAQTVLDFTGRGLRNIWIWKAWVRVRIVELHRRMKAEMPYKEDPELALRTRYMLLYLEEEFKAILPELENKVRRSASLQRIGTSTALQEEKRQTERRFFQLSNCFDTAVYLLKRELQDARKRLDKGQNLTDSQKLVLMQESLVLLQSFVFKFVQTAQRFWQTYSYQDVCGYSGIRKYIHKCKPEGDS